MVLIGSTLNFLKLVHTEIRRIDGANTRMF